MKQSTNKLLFKAGDEWSLPKIRNLMEVIEGIAHEWDMSLYPNQIEVIDFEGMINSYVSIGVPILYNHWSFGMQFEAIKKRYDAGSMGLALEMVLNTDPCINYIIDQNDMLTQCMVLCHSSVGHNFVFKNNFMFKDFTHADAIVNYLKFAKAYIQKCEEKYGELAVETWLDACHALENHGVDTYVRRTKRKEEQDEDYLAYKVNEERIRNFDEVWESTVPKEKAAKAVDNITLEKPEENILYFIEKHATWLPTWKVEIVRIVRKIAQYFYPQGKDKVINEGYATYMHMELMDELFNRGYIDEGSYLQFLNLHSSVVNQRSYTLDINPYTLGYSVFRDIKRATLEPTPEDKKFYGPLLHVPYREVNKQIASDYLDSSFLAQYLSPKVIRDMKFFLVDDDEEQDYYLVTEIHDEVGYDKIRQLMTAKNERGSKVPNIQVVGADLAGDRTLYLKYFGDRPLNEDEADMTMECLERLWGFDVELNGIFNVEKDEKK